jgi:hypothetical protein
MNPILAALLTWALGELGKFIIAFVTALMQGESFNAAVADAAISIVTSMDTATSLSNAEKRTAAVDALKNWHLDIQQQPPPDYALGALVELAVNRLRVQQGGVA